MMDYKNCAKQSERYVMIVTVTCKLQNGKDYFRKSLQKFTFDYGNSGIIRTR